MEDISKTVIGLLSAPGVEAEDSPTMIVVPVLELAALGACLIPGARARRPAAAFLASMVALRALRMVAGGKPALSAPRSTGWRLLPGAVPVAVAYELARALAVAWPAS